MVDLAAEIALRNARFRAWAAFGVPIVGGWVEERSKGGGAALIYRLLARCGVCGRGTSVAIWPRQAFMPPDVVEANSPVFRERQQLEGCPHLAPLLGEDPPAVRELTALELLAGDPPR